MAACVSGAPYAAARWLASRARAYGNSVSVTKEIGATVPSMSSTTAAGSAAAPRACASFAFFAAGAPSARRHAALTTTRVRQACSGCTAPSPPSGHLCDALAKVGAVAHSQARHHRFPIATPAYKEAILGPARHSAASNIL